MPIFQTGQSCAKLSIVAVKVACVQQIYIRSRVGMQCEPTEKDYERGVTGARVLFTKYLFIFCTSTLIHGEACAGQNVSVPNIKAFKDLRQAVR